MAAAAASAALVVQVVALLLVAAELVVEARLSLLAELVLKVQPLVLVVLARPEAQLPLPVQPLVPAHLVVARVARLLVLADLVVLVAAVPLQRLLSRQSFSAAMARNTP